MKLDYRHDKVRTIDKVSAAPLKQLVNVTLGDPYAVSALFEARLH